MSRRPRLSTLPRTGGGWAGLCGRKGGAEQREAVRVVEPGAVGG